MLGHMLGDHPAPKYGLSRMAVAPASTVDKPTASAAAFLRMTFELKEQAAAKLLKLALLLDHRPSSFQ